MNTEKNYTIRFFTKDVDAEELDVEQLYERLSTTFDDLIIPEHIQK